MNTAQAVSALRDRGLISNPDSPPRVQWLHSGSAHEVMCVRCVDGDYSIRLRTRDGMGYVADHHREARCWEAAAMAGLAPALVSVSKCGRQWIYHYTADARPALTAAELGILMAKVHTLSVVTERLQVGRQLAIYREHALRNGACGARLPDPERGELAAMISALEAQRPVLCHNDLCRSNVLGPIGARRVIDWEYAAIGSPYFDAAATLDSLQPAERDEFLEHAFPSGLEAPQLALAMQVYAATQTLWRAATGWGDSR